MQILSPYNQPVIRYVLQERARDWARDSNLTHLLTGITPQDRKLQWLRGRARPAIHSGNRSALYEEAPI